jgi:hypothetical protein
MSGLRIWLSSWWTELANIFTATLFGKLVIRVVFNRVHRAICKRPHGYTLLHHANQGGDEALK